VLLNRIRFRKQQEDYRAGVIAAAIGNSQGGKKGGGAFKPSDYFKFDPPKRVGSIPGDRNAITAGWDTWAAMANAAVPAHTTAPE
jgi:hypothetical protein